MKIIRKILKRHYIFFFILETALIFKCKVLCIFFLYINYTSVLFPLHRATDSCNACFLIYMLFRSNEALPHLRIVSTSILPLFLAVFIHARSDSAVRAKSRHTAPRDNIDRSSRFRKKSNSVDFVHPPFHDPSANGLDRSFTR